MNIMLSRILTYLNGTLFMDYRYQFCRFVVFNYEYLEDWDFEDVIEKSGLTKDEILAFVRLLGHDTYVTIKAQLEDVMIHTEESLETLEPVLF